MSVSFQDTRPPAYKRYPESDVFRRAVWTEGGQLKSIVARGPEGTPASQLDEILKAKCQELGVT